MAAAVVALFGCASTTRYTEGTATSLAVVDSLSLRLEVPAVVAGGQPVRMRLVVTNVSTRTLTIGLPGDPKQRADFVVMLGKKEFWEKLRGATILESLMEARIAPNDSLVFVDFWQQRTNHRRPVAKGRYRVKGILVETGIASEPVEFRIR